MRVIVTGASRGIGRAVCLRLAKDAAAAGRTLSIGCGASAHPDELETLLAALRGMGAKAVPLVGNLADPEMPARLVDEALQQFGGLDALVANAGAGYPADLLDQTVDDWDRLFALNTRSVWLLARAAHPALSASRGNIAIIGSMSGVHPHPGMGAYGITKAAVIMLGRLMAQEWARDGIRVNCVSPGAVLTPMTEGAYDGTDLKERREAVIPLGRIADPDTDIAGSVAFLLGADAGYVTGQNLLADGGISDAVLDFLPKRTK